MSRLRAAIIYLGRRLPAASSSLPEGLGTSSPRLGRVSPPVPRPLLGLAPGGVCLAGPVTRTAGEPLPHLFTLTALEAGGWRLEGQMIQVLTSSIQHPKRRYVSVALSIGSPRLGVTQHRALWSSDFPRTAFHLQRRSHIVGRSRPRSPGLLKHRFNYNTYETHCQASIAFDKMLPLDYHLLQ